MGTGQGMRLEMRTRLKPLFYVRERIWNSGVLHLPQLSQQDPPWDHLPQGTTAAQAAEDP